VSTEDQTLGPGAQRAALERWASAWNVELVGVFEDRGVSGATALDRRPGLLAALGCMAEHKAGLLVAAKRDRFARDIILAAQLERLVERTGAKLMSTDGASDGDSPEATMLRRILDVFASFERDLIRGRTRAIFALASFHPRVPAPGQQLPLDLDRAGAANDGDAAKSAASPRRLGWANLLARVFAVDVTICRKCGGRMRILDVVRDPDDIARILHGARAPPRPPRSHPPGQVLLFPC
jgi:DNA invertase Pin-like site-specific DNA recombinase